MHGRCRRTPAGLSGRPKALLEDTARLAQARTDADLSWFRQSPAERRRPVDPPLPASEHSPRQAGLNHAGQRRLLSGGIPLYSIA